MATTELGARSNALWGKKGNRGRVVAASICAVVVALGVAPAASPSGQQGGTYVPQQLLDRAKENPNASFDVIVQGNGREKTSKLADRLARDLAKEQGLGRNARAFTVSRGDQFASIAGFEVTLAGKDILSLTRKDGLLSITPDSRVVLQGANNRQLWDDAIGASWYRNSSAARVAKPVTIAIVDSGVDPGAGIALGSRFLGQFDLGGGQPSGDGRGHGTFVAGLAASNSSVYAGTTPKAQIVSLDVFDAEGNGTMSDVIRAADWILTNRTKFNIRVANFSLQSAQPSSFLTDPLDKAVERLWRAGIVVVASVGNYAQDGQKCAVAFAPANDPFVISVGAADVNGTISQADDFNAPWSAYGHTYDGFAKPELSAPGRYLIQPIPLNATLRDDFPDNAVDSRNFELSGTSFAAPIVSGAAAIVLGAHPDWTPDQVKGALMLSAEDTPLATPFSLGVGEVDVQRALAVSNPPNPNLGLNAFLVPDPTGGPFPLFDAASWSSAAQSGASWSSASWSSASWSSASWSSASWSSASWSSASWSSASWSDASWSSASWSNNALSDGLGIG